MPIRPRNGGYPQTIPFINSGWGADFFRSEICKGFFWDFNTETTYTFTPEEQFNIILNTDRAVAQNFLYTRDSDATYLTLFSRNPVCLMTEECRPLVTEDGTCIVI